MSRTGSKARWIHGVTGASSAAGRRRVALDADLDGRALRIPASPAVAAVHFNLPELRPWTCTTNPIPDPDRLRRSGAFPRSRNPGDAAVTGCARNSGEDIFNSWFGRIELESVGGGQARLSVPTRFLKSWIDTHYLGHITTTLTAEVRTACPDRSFSSARRCARPESRDRIPACSPGAVQGRPKPRRTPSAPAAVARPRDRRAVDRRRPGRLAARSPTDVLDFSGRALQSTCIRRGATRRRALAANRTPSFCPLFVHSAVGSERPIFCRLSRIAAASQGRSTIYLTAEKFMYGFVAASSRRPRSPSRSACARSIS